jgi:hypothetical protein
MSNKLIGKFDLISSDSDSAHLRLPTLPVEFPTETKVVSISPNQIIENSKGPEFIITLDKNNTMISIEFLY